MDIDIKKLDRTFEASPKVANLNVLDLPWEHEFSIDHCPYYSEIHPKTLHRNKAIFKLSNTPGFNHPAPTNWMIKLLKHHEK